ncbi:acyl-CoA dehydrogenase family protein [Bradyrhizobium paxllaeri]|uniref:acyl-CoA dehydrogenase family protein n=1 Tax=Bradyrhizobium paxllaeri TaxID=190148 RepID=UPI000B20A7BD|nr:acyl-CoA dehydrogenase family protein [Bradyrhizobium paxllaeri]
MSESAARILPTHEVTNQPPPLPSINLFEGDIALVEAVRRSGAGGAEPHLRNSGRLAGDERVQDLARLAHRYQPELRAFDRFGHRKDAIEFHPAYHELMQLVFGDGVHSLAWTAREGGHAARTALSYVWNQADQGVNCPTSMTYASVKAIRNNPALASALEPKILANAYDPRPIHFRDKSAITIGMAMTEKQGGSDLRATATVAVPAGDGEFGPEYLLTGHKWFCSAPMSDGFLTLARTEEGVTCFFLLRSLADGTRNPFFIQRLKDKLGNRSNASSEIEYAGTRAIQIGEEGRGIPTLIEMAHLTRLETAISSAAIIRRALIEAIHHTRYRRTFQRPLVDQPIMQGVLADVAAESEAHLALTMRAAQAQDLAATDGTEALLSRFLVPLAKFWVCKRTPPLVAELLECFGGNGYVEEGLLARLYREAPLNGIWEGSGNVICLDLVRVLRREPQVRDALRGEIRVAGSAALSALWNEIDGLIDQVIADEQGARWLAEQIAIAVQYSLLLRHAPDFVSDSFRASKIDRPHLAMGSLKAGASLRRVVERAAIG